MFNILLCNSDFEQQMHSRLIFILISICCLLAIFVCAVVDFVTTSGFTWSLQAIVSLVFGWFLSTPLLMTSRNFAKWLVPLTILVLPYLLLLEMSMQHRGWFVGLALPVAIVGIVTLWACFFLAKKFLYNRGMFRL